MRVIPRQEWLAGLPLNPLWRASSTTVPLKRGKVRGTAIHWPGGSNVYAQSERDPAGFVRGMQMSYRNGRGYDLGYGFVVTPNGDAYEARGWWRQASMGGDADPESENDTYLSIQLPVDNGGPHPHPSPQQVATTRLLIAEQRARLGGELITTHAAVDGPDNTSCPGPVLKAMVAADAFEPTGGIDEIPPDPPPPSEEDEMQSFIAVHPTGGVAVYSVGAAGVSKVQVYTGEDWNNFAKAGAVTLQLTKDQIEELDRRVAESTLVHLT